MEKKKLIWVVISIIIAGFSIWAVIAQSASFSMEDFSAFVNEADKKWLLGAILCTLGFIFFEGVAVLRIASSLGYKRNLWQGTVYGAADVYFSAITPSASGGQPASAYFMLIDKIPMTAITVILITNLMMYTLALLLLGGICCIFRFDIVLQMKLLSKLLVISGALVLLFLTVGFYLLLRKPEWFYKICNWFITIIEKIPLFKKIGKLRNKLNATMADYKKCAETVNGKAGMLFEAFFWNFLQRSSQYAVAFFVFMASGQGLKNSIDVFITQCFVSLGSNTVPIPGSMGVADYIMLDGYANIVGEKAATYMELLTRGMSFYGCIIVSALIVIIAFVGRRIGEKKC